MTSDRTCWSFRSDRSFVTLITWILFLKYEYWFFCVWIFPTCLGKGEYTVLHTSIIRYFILIWPALIFKIHINNYVSFSALLLYLCLRAQFLDQFSFSFFVLLLGYILNRFGMPKMHNFTFLLKKKPQVYRSFTSGWKDTWMFAYFCLGTGADGLHLEGEIPGPQSCSIWLHLHWTQHRYQH